MDTKDAGNVNIGRKRKLQHLNEGCTNEKPKLFFSKDFGDQNLALFQVPKTLVEDLKMGDRVSFVGPDDETAVIITSSATYELCKVESSNTMLLVPPSEMRELENLDGKASKSQRDGFVIDGSVSCIYEAKKTNPKLSQLESILDSTSYAGAESERSELKHSLKTFEQLCESVQASEAEVREGLQKLQAVEICGFWRRVSSTLMDKALDAILNQVIEHDLPVDKISGAGMVAALSPLGHEAVVVQHCLAIYARKDKETEEGCVALDMDKVAVFRAHQLFRSEPEVNDEPWPLDDFKVVWASRLPGVDSPDEALLKGVALKELRAGKPCLRYFPAERLAADPQRRFQELFAVRTKWAPEDLSPYVAALVNPLQSEADLLLTFARSSIDSNGNKLYSSR